MANLKAEPNNMLTKLFKNIYLETLTIEPRLPASIIFVAVICMILIGAITLRFNVLLSRSFGMARESKRPSPLAGLLTTPSSGSNSLRASRVAFQSVKSTMIDCILVFSFASSSTVLIDKSSNVNGCLC